MFYYYFNAYYFILMDFLEIFWKYIINRRIGEPGVYLEEIHVLEKERKKGFGKKLLDFVVKFA